MIKDQVIRNTVEFVKKELENDYTGHDFWHIHRVTTMSKKIAAIENANIYICELAALLHDVADEKLIDNEDDGIKKIENFLDENQVDKEDIKHIIEIISTMSYKGGTNKKAMRTLEGKIVQDADRLDAIGAIGVARCMCYTGAKQRPIYEPNENIRENMTLDEYRSNKGNAINHFYEKLLKLKDQMNTKTAKELAEGRHKFLEEFLDNFHMEWNGQK